MAEALDGSVLPIEVKFRKRVDQGDYRAVARFVERFRCRYGIVVTRDTFEWNEEARILLVPLLDFLLAF